MPRLDLFQSAAELIWPHGDTGCLLASACLRRISNFAATALTLVTAYHDINS